MSLQIPGASLYLPHWSCGDPSASGPLNAFALARTRAGVILSRADLVEEPDGRQELANATMCHGSGAFFSALYRLITAW